MANFIIAPTLTMGMRAPFEGIVIATKWPIGNSLGKIETYAESKNTVYMVQSSEHDKTNYDKIIKAIRDDDNEYQIEEVSL